MTTKKEAVYRTDLLPHRMNAGKEAKVRRLLLAWRHVAVLQRREQWRLVFQSGRPNKKHSVSRTGYDLIGTSYGQMVRWQVVGQIESFLSIGPMSFGSECKNHRFRQRSSTNCTSSTPGKRGMTRQGCP